MESPQTPTGSPESAAPTPISSEPITTLHSSSNLVELFFTVRDRQNHPVTTLTAADCTVRENKQPRPLKFFSVVRDEPLTLGILLDTSGSQTNVLSDEQTAASQFLEKVLRPAKDEAFLITFDISVNLAQDYTSSPAELARALDRAQINTGTGTGSFIPGLQKPKGTLLYDAIYLAAHDQLKQETGRHALVILTDGQDEGSSKKLDDAINAAQRANAIVYVLLVADPALYGSIDYFGDSTMKRLAAETGGRVFPVGHNQKKFDEAFAQINQELRTQYLASFAPLVLDGKRHSLDVECRGDNLHVLARKEYFAAPPAN
jgi:VWFA-related protein